MEIKRIGSQHPAKVRRNGLLEQSGLTVGGPLNDSIDEASHAKYHGSPYLSSMISDLARSATVKIAPRESNA